MKIILSIVIAILTCPFFVFAQSFIEPMDLAISTSKTTHLIFPAAIKSVDRGSADFLVSQPRGIQNILKVKAGKSGFTESSLSVITVDGKLYSFLVNYNAYPKELNYIIDRDNPAAETKTIIYSALRDDASLRQSADSILKSTHRWHGKKSGADGIYMYLLGTYVDSDILFFKMGLENESSISYDIESIRFFLKDKKKVKRTAFQEIEMKPAFVMGNVSRITHDEKTECLLAFDKFTVPRNKYLVIGIRENKGARQLSLTVKAKKLIGAVELR